MYSLTLKLLSGSGITPASHPVLVSLLERAAAPPGLKPSQFASAAEHACAAKRWHRDWPLVCIAFNAFVEAGAADSAVERALLAMPAIFAQDRVESAVRAPDLTLRREVAKALQNACNAKA